MPDELEIQGWLAKALESPATAESEIAAGRYNSAANRLYYACFQAAIAALLRAGVRTPNRAGRWGHDFVQAEFAKLIHHRRNYPAELAGELRRLVILRDDADYTPDPVSHIQVQRALSRARRLVQTVDRGDVQ